jgi:hypothetical protein
MTKPSLGAGNVEIELDGETVVLKPTLRAAQTISRQNGGILGAVDRVSKFDLDTLTQVVALGLNATGKDAETIPDKVWSTGMTDLVGPVTRYLSILANGGRPVKAGGGEEDADPRT